eukprot:TRINITY_DN28683_c0_g1_i1.p1 TRINITY_DN28683_c0_g1~~TRINITY_DN28683_c0_g1_i1.p1  ORF type:complete len:550 (+),score=133.12 TRINITY_DN28683_c0_g1_i1:25-1650(+)
MASVARQLALAYYFVVACLGIAIAHWLISVHRSPLPQEEIAAFAESLASSDAAVPWPKAHIRVSAASDIFKGEPKALQTFGDALSAALGSAATVSIASSESHSMALEACTAQETSAESCLAAMESVDGKAGLAVEEALGSMYDIVLVTADDCSALLLGTGSTAFLRWHQKDISLLPELAADTAAHLKATWLRQASFDEGASLFEIVPSYVFSFFLVGDCRGHRVAWDFNGGVLAPYLSRFLTKLESFFDLELDSQVVQCGSLGSSLEPAELAKLSARGNVIDPSMLQADFMRRAGEWPPDALTRDARLLPPLVRLVAFKPSEEVKLVDEAGEAQSSFAVQSFGVVAISRCDEGASGKGFMTDCEAQRVASGWVSSLRSWLSLPADEPLAAAARDCHGGLGLMAARPRFDGIADWELRILARAVHSRFVRQTAETLQNLVELVDSLPDVVVREEIAAMTFKATSKARSATSAANAGDLRLALAESRQALQLALTAMHDDSVVSQLYFSWEFKYAVYLPIGLPIIVPVFAAMVRELKARLRKK